MGKNRLFGTDGIRGTANKWPMTVDIVIRVGQALGYLLRQKISVENSESFRRPKVVIGKDTRLSGYMVEMALSSGLNSMGVDVQLLGPLPTPGIGFLTKNMRADAGIVVSASHNPYFDNGIKIFGADGFKIDKDWEDQIEKLVESDLMNSLLPSSEGVGRSKRIEDAAGRYIVYAKSTFPHPLTLEGYRIVLDCANGAAYKVAPAIFEELGAEVMLLSNAPNGTNINDKCGALYPDRVSEAVLKYRADIGISLDGDADRVILVDEKGRVINGDHILAICALHLKKKNLLKNNTVVATQMSNFGLEKALRLNGISLVKTDVGDKYVVEEMKKNGHVLGGENSGHIIFLDHATTGDGIIAALNVLAVMGESSKPLSDLNLIYEDVPQVLKNIRVNRRVELNSLPGFSNLMQKIEKELKNEGRVFVRFSGTEPLLRILVEGADSKAIQKYADEVALFVQKALDM
jgi:phosphoglucosamine mutase